VFRGSGLFDLESDNGRFELAGGAAVIGSGSPVPGQLLVGADRGEFGGVGTIVADVVISPGNAIAPGWTDFGPSDRVGALRIDGDLTLLPATNESRSRLVIQLSADSNDLLAVDGHLDLGNAILETSFLGSVTELDAAIAPDNVIPVVEADDPIEGVLQLLSGEVLENGDLFEIVQTRSPRATRFFQIFYGPGSPYGENRVVFTGLAIPEPGTLSLLAAGIAFVAASRRTLGRAPG